VSLLCNVVTCSQSRSQAICDEQCGDMTFTEKGGKALVDDVPSVLSDVSVSVSDIIDGEVRVIVLQKMFIILLPCLQMRVTVKLLLLSKKQMQHWIPIAIWHLKIRVICLLKMVFCIIVMKCADIRLNSCVSHMADVCKQCIWYMIRFWQVI